MEIIISNFKVPVTTPTHLIKSLVLKNYNLNDDDIISFKFLRASIDARKKSHIRYDYRIYIALKDDKSELLNNPDITLYEATEPITYHQWHFPLSPIIIGFGPSGMFAALYLARCHAKPIIIERGSRIEQRKKDVEDFLKNKRLNSESNIQFGEGGAGTFSDGKLTTNLHNEYINFVLQEFYKHGATEDITYDSNPHVGTDYLEKIVKNIREEIITLGGEFHFNTRFTEFEKGKTELKIYCHNNQIFKTQHLLLCLGHSARDTIRHLYRQGVQMEAKNFSIGVRIEHLQSKINTMQYGKFAKYLPAASYKGVVHLKHRNVYTFCMCPGGSIIASTSDIDSIVTNGMSEKKRNKANANSALLVGINTEDFYKESPLDGLDYQEKYEKKAFHIAENYQAPCNLMKEFSQNKIATHYRSIKPSYPHGVIYCDLNRCLPDFVIQSLRESIPLFNKKMPGFNDPDAVLTGIETRSSSPVRFVRNEKRQSNIQGIYPVGEGAGYAGGITSAAIDGLKTAIEITK